MSYQLVGTDPNPQPTRADKRERLLAAARQAMLEKGYPATTVDQICAMAGVTKGAFFHYFDSKEAVGRAVVERFVAELIQAFQEGTFRDLDDPLERVVAYVDFTAGVCRQAILKDGCILGLFSQELAATKPDIRGFCEQSFRGWAHDLKGILDEATARHEPSTDIDTESLAEQFIALVEGALILRRAYSDPHVVERTLNHFRDYVRLLFESSAGTR
jgi:TetR/AcrR family transcriptional regulator, transcriptional repressor for nem operon